MSGILFIDAEQPFADQTAAALRARGFQVTQVDDGKDGLDHAAKERPDLIVLCVELPKMSGYSICNKLKKDNDLKSIPLIITSKEATPETFAQHKKLKTRAEDYLIKPFSESDLIEKIGALIALPSAGGASAPAAAPPPSDGLDGLESLGADLDLGPSASGGERDVRLGADDLAGLDGLDAPAPATAAPAPSLDEDSLLSGLDGLSDPARPAAGNGAGGMDDLELGGSVKDDGLAGLGAQLDALSEPEPPPAPAPAPAPVPPPRAAPPPAPPRPAPTSPPAPTATASNAADLAALQAARRENSDLKAKVAELEARLKQAEEAAKAAAMTTPPTGVASSAREVLNLKQQLRAKDDEILQKEQALVDVQEQLERLQAEMQQKLAESSNKDIEISTLKARVQSLSDERDELEAQVRDRLQAAEAERDQLRGELDAARADADQARADGEARAAALTQQLDEAKKASERLAGRVRELEAEVKEKEQDAVKAYQRLKSEEQLREKARQAAELAVKLLKGDVEMKGGGAAELEL